VGCEARKIPAAGEVFFLDFTFYRTYQGLEERSGDILIIAFEGEQNA
jgi:hypothetical protein